MNKEFVNFIKETVSIVVIAFILAMILRAFVIEGRIIPSGSMCLPYSFRTGLWSINSSIISKNLSAGM